MNAQIKKISEATEADIEKILKRLGKKVGLGEKITSILLITGGLHYTLEKVASETLLGTKPINAEVRKLLRLVNLGFKEKINGVYYQNKLLKSMDKKHWTYSKVLKETQDVRNKFIKNAEKLQKGKK